MMMPGDVILTSNPSGLLSKLIRFFAKTPWSHSALGFFPYHPVRNGNYHLGAQELVFEANLTVSLSSVEDVIGGPGKLKPARVYRFSNAIIAEMGKLIDEAMSIVFFQYNGHTYGFAQLFWFVWRWIVEGLGLPRRWAVYNFFPGGEICTEVVYRYFEILSENDTPGWTAWTRQLKSVLDKLGRNRDAVHPGDIEFICDELVKRGLMIVVYEKYPDLPVTVPIGGVNFGGL